MKTRNVGQNNPNYKDGRSLKKHPCIELNCKNQVCYATAYLGDGRCRSCANRLRSLGRKRLDLIKRNKNYPPLKGKIGKNHPWYNHRHTEKSKQKISAALKGEKHPNWKGGISFEPYSLQWDEQLKSYIRNRDNNICKLCNKTSVSRKLDVHHIDYNKKNCSENNLISLCNKCHLQTNFNRQHWKTRFQNLMENVYGFPK